MSKTIVLVFFLFYSFFLCATELNSISSKIQEYNKSAFSIKDNDLKEANRLNKLALQLVKKNRYIDLIIKSDTYSLAGTLALQEKKYETALNYFFTSLHIRRKSGKSLLKIAGMYANIANLYYEMDDYKRAIYYYKECVNYKSEFKDHLNELIRPYNGLALTYEAIYKTDSAIHYYQKALEIIPKVKDQNDQAIADVYSNLGQLYETKGQFILANAYLEKALKIQHAIKDYKGMAWTYHHLGIVSDLQSDSPNAKSYFHKADRLTMKQQDLEIQRDISESWVRLYTREKKEDSVIFYLENYKSLNDSINQQKTNKNLYNLQIKYETKEKEIAIKNAKERENFYIIGAIIISLAFVFILFFLIRNYRQKQRIALLQVDVKNNEINELLNQQETASYAAMLEGQDQERLRIARELHDRLGSTLATIKLGLQNEDVTQAQQQVALVNTAISEVRTISHDLSGGNIEQYGLAAALTELKNTLDRSGKITLNLFMEAVNIQASLHVTIYRIVQELVSNTLKHAEASEITLQLSTVDEQLNLIYEDNGKGFDLAHYQPGMGITNIRHRLEKWHGTLEIDAQPNRGTIVILTVPITSQHD